MIETITIPSDGGFYTFPNANVTLSDREGFGNPEPKVGLHEYSNAHGGLMASQYYKTRRISFSGHILAVDHSSFAQARRDFYQAFSFLNEEKLLKFTTFDGRDLQCLVMAATTIRDTQIGPTASFYAVELTASDPLFYAQTTSSVQGGIATLTGAGFALPFEFPLALSGSLSGVMTLVNSGNARVYPSQIRLIGPGTNFTLSNKTTNKNLSFNGTLLDDEYLLIDPKRKTALKNGVTNVYGSMSGDWWDLYYGNNTVTLVVGSGNSDETGVEVSWRNGWWGL